MIGDLGQGIEAISALRRMVLLSSMTITLTPRSLDKSVNSLSPGP
jgi:hypothetical protein